MADAPPLTSLAWAGASRVVGRAFERLGPGSAQPAALRDAANAGPDYGRTAEPSWLEVDWAPHVRDMEVRGHSVRYVDFGPEKGKPIVLIHGISSNWQNWLEQLPRLAAEGYRSYAIDLPGFGASEMPERESYEVSMSAYADVVDDWCKQLGLTAVPVVGHSMGGFIAAELAIRHPKRVERLILVGAAGISHQDLSEGPMNAVARGYKLVTARELARVDALLRRSLARHTILGIIFRYPTLIRGELIYEITRGRGAPAFGPAMRGIIGYDIRDRFTEIACPTLILWGSDDMLAPLRDADEYERLIPDARKVVFEDTGHMVNSERPDAFNEALLEFLGETPAKKRGGSARRKSAAAAS